MRRRSFLGLVPAAAVLGPLAGCSRAAPERTSPGRRAWSATNPLRGPALLDPPRDDEQRFVLALQTGTTEFVRSRPAPTWGVNGAFLGPTLRMRTGDRVALTVDNRLPEASTLHWHGMRPPAVFDGGPHQLIAAGGRWEPTWTVENAASTTWYHPHLHGVTAMQVFRGIAGMIIVEDDHAAALPLPRDYGIDDLPCIVQDRTLDADGQPVFETEPNFGQLGSDILVNGTLDAFVDVSTTRVRLRLLNASNARRYHLGLADGRPLTLVATDAGLLPHPVDVSRVALGPGERAEVLATLAPGERVLLDSLGGDERIDGGTLPVLELRARSDLSASPPVPGDLGGLEPLVAPEGATVRRFRLQGHDAINGASMDLTRIDEVVPTGAVEVWELENDVYAHNFHVHGVDLSILDRDGRAPEPYEVGRKDTVHLHQKSRARLVVRTPRSADPVHPFMYHCHILRHEDSGMMGQFVAVDPGTEAGVNRTIPAM